MNYIAYTNGFCDMKSVSRCGGAAYVMLVEDGVQRYNFKHGSKGYAYTNTNKLEMLAIISAMAAVPNGASLQIFSESRFAICTLLEQYIGKDYRDMVNLFKMEAMRLGNLRLSFVGDRKNAFNYQKARDMAYKSYLSICQEYHEEPISRK